MFDARLGPHRTLSSSFEDIVPVMSTVAFIKDTPLNQNAQNTVISHIISATDAINDEIHYNPFKIDVAAIPFESLVVVLANFVATP